MTLGVMQNANRERLQLILPSLKVWTRRDSNPIGNMVSYLNLGLGFFFLKINLNLGLGFFWAG